MYSEALAVISLQLVVDTSAPWACVEAFFIVFSKSEVIYPADDIFLYFKAGFEWIT